MRLTRTAARIWTPDLRHTAHVMLNWTWCPSDITTGLHGQGMWYLVQHQRIFLAYALPDNNANVSTVNKTWTPRQDPIISDHKLNHLLLFHVTKIYLSRHTVCQISHTTVYKWCTVASGTFKYVVPRLTCHHEGTARVMTCQPRDNIFECSTSKRASSVLSYDQLRASTKSRWIIYLRLCFTPKKHRNSLCVTV